MPPIKQHPEGKPKQQGRPGISDAEHVKDAGDRKDAPSGNSKVSVKEQKIAINLAGFYAVECGVGLLIALKGGTPEDWLEKIVTKATGPEDLLVLGRFANATWKAGQPFINWDRIKNDHFISANYLPEESTQKIMRRWSPLPPDCFYSLQEVKGRPKEVQLKKLQQLLRDEQYALRWHNTWMRLTISLKKKSPSLSGRGRR